MSKLARQSLLAVSIVLLVAPSIGQAGVLEPSLRQSLQRKLWAKPSLRTACLLQVDSVAETRKAEFIAVVDAAQAAAQAEELSRLVSGSLGVESRVTKVHELPTTQLLDALKQRIAKTQSLQACRVAGAFYDYRLPTGNTLDLVLYGQFQRKEQLAELANACDDLMQQNPVWSQLQESRPHVLFLAEPVGDFAPTTDQDSALRSLRQRFIQDRNFHKNWVDLKSLYDRAGNVTRQYATVWLDAQDAEPQLRRLEELLRASGEGDVRISREFRLPLSQLLDQLNAELGGSSEFGREARWVAGAHYESTSPQKSTLDLVLYGQFFRQGMEKHVVSKCAELIRNNPAWNVGEGYQVVPVDRGLHRLAPAQIPPTPAADKAAAPAMAQEADMRALEAQGRIRSAIKADPKLNGVWIEVSPFDYRGRTRHYDVVLWLDPDRANDQRAAAEALLKQHLDAEYRITEEVRLPLSSLVARLQNALEEELGKGTWVAGAHYFDNTPTGDAIEIALYGRLCEHGEHVRVLDQCKKLFAADPAFRSLGPRSLVPSARKLILGTPPDKAIEPLRDQMVRQRDALVEEVKEDRDLHGAWVDMAACLKQDLQLDHYDVYLWLDRGHAASQKARIEARLKAFGANYAIVDETALPFAELVTSLQKRVEEIYGLGCYVSGAYYQRQQPQPIENASFAELVLYGKVWDDRMKRRIVSECDLLRDRDPAWRKCPGAGVRDASRLIVADRGLLQHSLSPDSKQMREGLRNELKRDPRLHGAWIDLVECYGHHGETDHYEVYMWFDPTRERPTPASKTQEAASAARIGGDHPPDSNRKATDTTNVVPPPGGVAGQTIVTIRSWGRCSCATVLPAPIVAAADQKSTPGTKSSTLAGIPSSDPSQSPAQVSPVPPPFDQQAELRKLLDKWVGAKRYVVLRTGEAPVARLVEEAQRSILADLGPGCYLVGAYFSERPNLQQGEQDQVELVLYGRVFDQSQKTRVMEHVNSAKRRDPAWRRLPIPGPKPESVVVDRNPTLPEKKPSPEAGQAAAKSKAAVTTAEPMPATRPADPITAWATSEATVVDRGLILPDKPSPQTQIAIEQVRQAVQEDPVLHGVWADVAECFDHFGKFHDYQVYLWLDDGYPSASVQNAGASAGGERQRAEALKLLDSALGESRYVIVEEACLPFSRLLSSLRQRAAEEFGKGCFVRGGYYRPADPGQSDNVELALYGRVFEEWQKTRIREVGSALQHADPRFNHLPGPREPRLVVSDRRLVLYQPSDQLLALRGKIHKAVAADDRLQGVWVDLAECADHRGRPDHYEVYLWLNSVDAAAKATERPKNAPEFETRCCVCLDRRGCPHYYECHVPRPIPKQSDVPSTGPANPDVQRLLVGQILDKYLGVGRHVTVDEAVLPLNGMIADLRSKIEAMYGLGTYLTGAHYALAQGPQPRPTVELWLDGRVFSDEQRTRISDVCQQLKDANPVWEDLPGPGKSRLIVRRDSGLEIDSLSPDSVRRLNTVRQLLFNDPELHGTWVDLAETKNRHGDLLAYEICLWLDSDKAERQRALATAVLNRCLDGKHRVIRESMLPLGRIVTALQQSVPQGGFGSYLSGAYYAQQETTPNAPVEIRPFGRAKDPEEQRRIVSECERLKKLDPSWTKAASWRGNAIIVADRALPVYNRSPDAEQRLRRIQELVFKQRELQDSWIDLDEYFDHQGQVNYYRVYVRRSGANSSAAKGDVMPILNTVLNGSFVIAIDESLSGAELLSSINLAISNNRSLDGCLVQGICFTPSQSVDSPVRPKLNVYGRLADDAQREKVTRLANFYLQVDPLWRPHLKRLDVAYDYMAVVPSDTTRGHRFFNLGTQHFWRGSFDEAVQSFQQAITECPSFVEYRYWLAAAEMQRGQSERAYNAMLAAVGRRASDEDSRVVYRSLERLQGPARTALTDMESRARLEYYLIARQARSQ